MAGNFCCYYLADLPAGTNPHPLCDGGYPGLYLRPVGEQAMRTEIALALEVAPSSGGITGNGCAGRLDYPVDIDHVAVAAKGIEPLYDSSAGIAGCGAP